MDALDIAILRELSQAQSVLPAKVGLASSYGEMSRKLGHSRGTVRSRVEKLYTSGVIRGSSVFVNPILLGLYGATYAFDVSPSRQKSKVIEQLKLMDGIHTIHNFRGSWIGIHFMYEDEADLKKSTSKFLELSGASEGLLSRVPYPHCAIVLDKSEYSLIKVLSSQGFRSYAELSRELGVSVRTVKRKLAKLLGQGAILSIPRLDYRKIDAGLPVDIVAVFDSKESKMNAEKKILPIVKDYLHFLGNAEEYIVYNLILPNLALVNELSTAVNQVEGVRSTRTELVDEHIDMTPNLQSYFERLKVSS